jgi:hypothetical protein
MTITNASGGGGRSRSGRRSRYLDLQFASGVNIRNPTFRKQIDAPIQMNKVKKHRKKRTEYNYEHLH